MPHRASFLLLLLMMMMWCSWLAAADVFSDSRALAARERQELIIALPDPGVALTLQQRLAQGSLAEASVLMIELGLSGKPSARAIILAQINRADAVLTERSLRSLAMLGLRGSAQIQPVIRLLGHDSPAVRIQAIACLATVDDLRLCPFIINRLADQEPSVRQAAVEALKIRLERENMGMDPAVWTVWYQNRQDASDQRFAELAKQLRQFASQQVIATIQTMPQNRSESVRSVELLEPFLNDTDPLVVLTVRQKLSYLANDLYPHPTQQETAAAMAMARAPEQPPAVVRNQSNETPSSSSLFDLWGGVLIAVIATSVVLWLSGFLLRTAPSDQTHQRAGTAHKDKSVRRSRSPAIPVMRRQRNGEAGPKTAQTTRGVIEREPISAPADTTAALSAAAIATTTDTTDAINEDPFTVLDRFASGPPPPSETPSSVFSKTARTSKMLDLMRSTRRSTTTVAEQGENQQPSTPIAQAAMDPQEPSPAEVIHDPEASLDIFTRFSLPQKLPAEVKPVTSVFTTSQATTRWLQRLRASSLKGPEPEPEPEPEPNQLAAAAGETAADALVAPWSTAPTDVGEMDPGDDPFSQFDRNQPFAAPAIQQTPSSVFSQTERARRALQGLRGQQQSDKPAPTASGTAEASIPALTSQPPSINTTPEPADDDVGARQAPTLLVDSTDLDDPFLSFNRHHGPLRLPVEP